MPLRDKIETDYKNALKSKDKNKISTYRLILSGIKDLDISNRSGPEKKETDEILKDGWLHTGDIGEIDSNGYLKITDRKKDIIVNHGGDNISPSKIENLVCNDAKIKQCLVYGDKKNYLVALIVVDKKDKNDSTIRSIIENNNKKLSVIEKIKKFKLIEEEFTIENGLMTPTLKLKRKKIIEKYKQDLENLYS